VLLAALSRLWLAAVLLFAAFFPGILLALLLAPNDASNAAQTLLSLGGGIVSYFFWRGVRSSESGKRLTDWALSLGLRE